MSNSSAAGKRRKASDPPPDDTTHTRSRTQTSAGSDGQPAHSTRTGSSGGSFSRFIGGTSEPRRSDSQSLSSPPALSDGSFRVASDPSVSTTRFSTPFRSRASSAIASKIPFGAVRTHSRAISVPVTAVTFRPTRSVSDSASSHSVAGRFVSVELDPAQERYPSAPFSPAVTSVPSLQDHLSPRTPAGHLNLSDFDEFFEHSSSERLYTPVSLSPPSPDEALATPPSPDRGIDSATEVGDVSGHFLNKVTDLRPHFGRKSEKKTAREGYPRPGRSDVLEKAETNKLTKFWNLSERQAQQSRKEQQDAEERELTIIEFLNSHRNQTSPDTVLDSNTRPGFHPRLSSISEHSREAIGPLPRFKMDSSLLTPGARILADEKDKQKRAQDAQEMYTAIARKAERTNTPLPPYEFLELIGKGTFGRVYKCRDRRDGKLVAVKIATVDGEYEFEETIRDFRKEVSILQQLKSNKARNVNVIHDAFDLDSHLWIVADYCTGGSIRTLMRAWGVTSKQSGLPENMIIPIARELAIALKDMHGMHIIHRDIKCANVYITETGDIQLGDFGIVGVIDDGKSKRKTVIGTPHYMSKELIDKFDTDEVVDEGYGTEVDIWAYGCTVYEMAVGRPPYANVSSHQVAQEVEKGPPRLEGAEYSTELCDFVAYCLKMDAKTRPSAGDILKHPFIANTSKQYPTRTLVKLIERYKMWEHGGGSRSSLWVAAPSDAAKPSLEDDAQPADNDDNIDDGWNFSTSADFDRRFSQMPSLQDGDLDYLQAPEGAGLPPGLPQLNTKDLSVAERIKREHSELSANRGERSLARVFNTDDETGYQVSSPPIEQTPAETALAPPPSDLPLRNFTSNAPTRESMIEIDLDEAGVNETATSTFALHMNAMDDNTIKPRKSTVDDDDDDFQYGQQEDASKRDTMAWSFPKAEAPQPKRDTMAWSFSSAQPAQSEESDYSIRLPNFDFGGDDFAAGFRPGLKHTATEPIGHFRDFSHDAGSSAASPARQSVTSMIDLDMGLADPPRHLDDPAEIVRPSTASSAAGSTMTDMTSGNPFDLEDDPVQNELDRSRFSYHKAWHSEHLRKRQNSHKAPEMHARGISLSSTGSGTENNYMTSSNASLGDLMPPSEVFESGVNLEQSNTQQQWQQNYTAYDGLDMSPQYLPSMGDMSFTQDGGLHANGITRSREPSNEPTGPEVDFPDLVAPNPGALHEDAPPRLLEEELGATLNDLATALGGVEQSLRQYANLDDDVDDDLPSDVESGFESSRDTATEDEGADSFLTARRYPARSRSPGGD